MRERDKSSKTLTVGQLIDRLSRLDPTLPVVMSQTDEPCGFYGVRSFDVRDMQREDTYGEWMDVFHDVSSGMGDRYEPPQKVVYLHEELPWLPTIDADPVRPEIEP